MAERTLRAPQLNYYRAQLDLLLYTRWRDGLLPALLLAGLVESPRNDAVISLVEPVRTISGIHTTTFGSARRSI